MRFTLTSWYKQVKWLFLPYPETAFMMLLTASKTTFLSTLISCMLPVLAAVAQPDNAALTDSVLENMLLPEYRYMPGGKEVQESWQKRLMGNGTEPVISQETLMNRRKVENMLRDNPDMPMYMKRAYRIWLQTDVENLGRFSKLASEFQKQELREQLIQHIDDPEKLDKMISVLYSKPDVPYMAKDQSGYAINQGTGEIIKENGAPSRAYESKLSAQINRQSARKRESSRSRTYREDRNGNPVFSKHDYLKARKQAVATNRPDLVEEEDRAAARNGLID